MDARRRFGLIALAAVVAVVAFVVARPGDDEEGTARSGDAAAETAPATAPQGEASPAEEQSAATEEAAAPAPRVTRIRVRDGRPVGGVREITAEKGETVRIVVSSDTPQHVHLHGYDVIRDAAPGDPARFDLEADIEGIFEIELEGPHTQIASLRVEP